MDEYEIFENKFTTFIDIYDNLYPGKIVGFDLDIGFTLVDKDDPDRYLCCLRGPSSSFWKKHWNKKTYYCTMDYILKQLKAGKHIYDNAMDEIYRKYGNLESFSKEVSQSSCAFGA